MFQNREVWGSARQWATLLQQERGGPAFTVVVDSVVLGCAGVVLTWTGVGSAWAAFSREIFQYKIWLTRVVRRALSDIVRTHNLHRVEAVVLAENAASQRWIELLGFRYERGRACRYTPDGQDIIRYELLRN